MPVPTAQRVRRVLVADQTVQKLHDAIIDGALVPGDELALSDLAGWLKVSKQPILEALLALEAAHFIDAPRHQTAHVAAISGERAQHGFSLVLEILAHTTRLLVPELTNSECARIVHACREQRSVTDAIAPGGGFDEVVTTLGGPRILEGWRHLGAYSRWAWAREVTTTPPLEPFNVDQFVTALTERDAMAAEASVREWAAGVDPLPPAPGPVGNAPGSIDDPSVPLRPIEKPALRDMVYHELQTAILTGALAAGQPLHDTELQALLQVSREPIRQAMRQLFAVGMVELTPGRTPRVAAFDQKQTNRALMLSNILNEYGVRRALSGLTPEQETRLNRVRLGVHGAELVGAPGELARAIGNFFEFFSRHTHNVVVEELVSRVDQELTRFLLPGSSSAAIDTVQLRKDIDALAAAVRDGDSDIALEVLDRTYSVTRAVFFEQLRESAATDQ